MTETKARFTPEQLREMVNHFERAGDLLTASALDQASEDAEVLARFVSWATQPYMYPSKRALRDKIERLRADVRAEVR